MRTDLTAFLAYTTLNITASSSAGGARRASAEPGDGGKSVKVGGVRRVTRKRTDRNMAKPIVEKI